MKELIDKSRLNSSNLPQNVSSNNTGIFKKPKSSNFKNFAADKTQNNVKDIPDSPAAFESYNNEERSTMPTSTLTINEFTD